MLISNSLLGKPRVAVQGRGVLEQLRGIVDCRDSSSIRLLTSPSFDPRQHWVFEEAMQGLVSPVVVPRILTAEALSHLRREVGSAEVVVAIGGGNVMDAGKAVTKPDGARLVLVPTTLSGSEHSGNTSWWAADRKIVRRVGLAEAVVADPGVLVPRREVLAPGAMHVLAHGLAIARQPNAPSWQVRMAAMGVRDLLRGLAILQCDVESSFHLLGRGAWNAAVAYILSGPLIGPHHWLVHKFAPPSAHALFSANLTARALLETSFHSEAVLALGAWCPDIPAELLQTARSWLDQAQFDMSILQTLDQRSIPPTIRQATLELARLT